MAEIVLELLGTRGCHLCEQAELVLESVAGGSRLPAWHYVDIAEDDGLVASYGARIPVLRCRIDGRTSELGWPFGTLDVLRLLRGDTGD